MEITPERYEHIGGLPPRQRGNVRQLGGAERDPVYDGTRVQVARPAGTLRQLAHHLHPHEPVVEQGCA